jgi:pimeloyl-ACP methyl ester carboxylesterase
MIEALSYPGSYPRSRRSTRIHHESGVVSTPERGSVKTHHYRPDGVAEGPTVLIAPGWGEGIRVLDVAARALARQGHIVVTMDHLRTHFARANPEDYKSSTLEAVYDSIVEEGNDVQIVAHSEGAISTVKMLARRSQSAKRNLAMPTSVVFAAPAGFIGPDNWIHLIGRAVTREIPGAIAHNLRPLGGRAIQAAAESVTSRYHVMRNIDLGIREAKEIASTDLVPDTIGLSAEGINFTLISCLRDGIFPHELMYRHTQTLRDTRAVRWEEADMEHHEFLANDQVLNQIANCLD